MNGTDLKFMCKGQGMCDKCPVKDSICKRWKEDVKKLADMQPWQLDEFIELSENIAYYKNYKRGAKK